jgi:hypothetical protein
MAADDSVSRRDFFKTPEQARRAPRRQHLPLRVWSGSRAGGSRPLRTRNEARVLRVATGQPTPRGTGPEIQAAG